MQYLAKHDTRQMSNSELLDTFISVRLSPRDDNYEINSANLRNEILHRMGENVGQTPLAPMALRPLEPIQREPNIIIDTPKMYKVTIFIERYEPYSVYRKTLEGGIRRQLKEAKMMSRGDYPFEIVGYEQVVKGYYREVYRQKFDPKGNPIQ